MSGEPALHRSVPKVESLLGRGESAEGFLSRPAVDVAAHLFPGADRKLIGRRLGAYRIDSRLGAGGMGEVYRARDMKLGRDVAIKVLPPIFTSDLQRLKRFEREARMLAALNHPHIGAIYGLEDVDGLPALVLELVEGPTLAERLSHGALPVSEALSIARQTAEALG
jgi:serine/threonine protein kinase